MVVGVGRVQVELALALVVPATGGVIFSIFALVASTVYVVEFLPVMVIVVPLTAVTVPLIPDPFPNLCPPSCRLVDIIVEAVILEGVPVEAEAVPA